MKKKVIIILLSIVGVLILLFAAMSVYIGISVVEGSTQLVTNEETKGVSDSFWKTYGVDYDGFCSQYEIEKLELKSSFDGHVIPADYIYTDKSADIRGTVVMVHGLGGNRYTNYPVAKMFLEMGFDVVTYDQRSSNENTAEKTTFGYWEKYDLADCLDYVEKEGRGGITGVWGTSFGGATACLAVGYGDTAGQIDFLVLDCPVSSMEWMVREEMKGMDIGIPIGYMTWCGNAANKVMLGFSYDDADAAAAMKNADMPVLVINSRADTLTPYFMGEDIYESIPGDDKMIWTVDDSEHTEMWLDYNSEYIEKVSELIEMCA